MTVAIKINEELNGIELYFNSKPQQTVLSELKSNGFRWSGFKKCWYTKQTEKAFQIAKSLTNNEEVVTAPKEETKTAKRTKKTALNLWEATQWTEIEVNKDQNTKEIAKEIRSHVKKRFPNCKFSVRTDGKGWTDRINFSIKSSPYEEDSKYLNAIREYCDNLVNAYNVCYDSGDSYTDIPASYNFYFFNTSVDYDYKQTEVTEEIKKDMLVFDEKLEEFEKAEEERKYQEFQEWQKQQALRDEEYKKQREEEKKQVENIYNSIEVEELEENKQYFVIGSEFANLNKNNTIEQYREEVEEGDYTLQDVKITKEVHFSSLEALENFSNMLLNDFEFLTGTGGSYTDDNRLNSMTDFYNMDDEEKQSVKWLLKGVAIYYNNELQFIADAQGYSYARYVGLVDNTTIKSSITVEQVTSGEELETLKQQSDELETISADVIQELNISETWENENWKEYKEAIKIKLNKYNFKLTKDIIQQMEIESLKASMYKLLQEVDGIQEQFEKADIQKGEKLTLFYISDWGSIVTSRITFDNVTNSSYAQYDNAVKLTFTPERKRKLHYKYFYSTLLVFKGWHSLPETVLNHVEESNGMRITKSKYHSCDHKQYDEILNYFSNQDIKPIVNTYKPQF
jgi:uncharacterized protein YdhG (YjbR/CyaY superfamily)